MLLLRTAGFELRYSILYLQHPQHLPPSERHAGEGLADGHPCSGSSADNASAVTCVCAFVLGYLGYLGHLGHEQGLPTLALLVVGLLLRCP